MFSIAWFGVFIYTHAMFFKNAMHEVGKKDSHPAQDFIRNAKNLRETSAERKFASYQSAMDIVCQKHLHKNLLSSCLADARTLYHMDSQVAYHYLALLRDSDLTNLKGPDAEHPCMRINAAGARSDCYQDILGIKDLTVAFKMADLLKAEVEGKGSKGRAVTLHDAKIACALSPTKDLCIHDVLGTGDIETAEIYGGLAAPEKDANGKFVLGDKHHKFTEKDAIQSCKLVHPDDRQECQDEVMKLDDEEHMEHYVHLLLDQEHHKEDVKRMTKEEALSLCETVKNNKHKRTCQEDIHSLPNRHMADHFIQLYGENQADVNVPEKEAEKLCHHLRLTHHKHKHNNCLQTLVQMKGFVAASHYAKLLRLHQEKQTKVNKEKKKLIGAQAKKICKDVRPQARQEECIKDVLLMTNEETAEKYADLLSPPVEDPPEENEKPEGKLNEQTSAPGGRNTFDKKRPLKEQAKEVCQKTAEKSFVNQCVAELNRLSHVKTGAAEHFIELLLNSGAKDLSGEDAEHPCAIIADASHRSRCYDEIININELTVAKKMARLLRQEALDDSVTIHDAQIACALSMKKNFCIHDVLAAKDLDLAESFQIGEVPAKGKDGKFILQDVHHQMTESEAADACKKLPKDEQKLCQVQVAKMGEEDTAEHFIHLLQDAQFHKLDAKPLNKDEARALCAAVTAGEEKDQCSREIVHLHNRHMADHFLALFEKKRAKSLVSQLEAEKLCHHLRLAHHTHKQYESCVDTLKKMKGTEAATHYSSLLKMQRTMKKNKNVNDDGTPLTSAQAATVCSNVTPKERKDECYKDVQSMKDLETAETYARLLSPPEEGADPAFKKKAEDACGHSIHPDDVGECVDELSSLQQLNPILADHYMELLKTTSERNLEGSYSEHPCLKLKTESHRATCYDHVLATKSLHVARKISLFIKADEDHKPAVSLHDASIACALAKDKGLCIHDVIGTGDLEAAEMYANHNAPQKDEQGNLALESHHHRLSQKEAEQACRLVHADDKVKCQEHVLMMDDAEMAQHYIHLMLDVEHHQDATTVISEADAQLLCKDVSDIYHNIQCVRDVHMLPNQHIAEHLIKLYDEKHAEKKASKTDAERLCNHLKLSKKTNNDKACVQHLTGLTGIEAAAHCSKLLSRQTLEEKMADGEATKKTLLTREQANSICGEFKPRELAEECRRDVMTLNDLVIAKSYAQHFASLQKSEPEEKDTSKNGQGENNEGKQEQTDRTTFRKKAEDVCKKKIHPDDVKDCAETIRKLSYKNFEVAQHFLQLLLSSKQENMDGEEAEHPCVIIRLDTQREKCYRDVMSTNDLVVAKEIAQLMKNKEKGGSGALTLHDATIACALAKLKEQCIHDVLGTMDAETADSYEKYEKVEEDENGKLKLEEHHHRRVSPTMACSILRNPEDNAKCKEHIEKLDKEQAEHYIHLVQDAEHHLDLTSEVTVGEDGAQALCKPITHKERHKQCLKDVSVLPNEHIAKHLVSLYNEKHTSMLLSKKNAEQLCNHLRLSNKDHDHEECVEFLTKSTGLDAAAHVSKLLVEHRAKARKEEEKAMNKKEKKLLTPGQASTLCKEVKDAKDKVECKRAVQTFDDEEVAQRFVDMINEGEHMLQRD